MQEAALGQESTVDDKQLHVREGNIPFGFMLYEAPDNVQNVVDAKQPAKPGDTISIRGRVGGLARPFVDGLAAFTIVGRGSHACSDHADDQCKTPWDYCCTPRDELRAHSATLQIVDESGAPIRTDIKGRRGIQELSDLTVVGKVVSTNGGSLIIKASGMYLNDA